jgi:hypothetical protein
MRMLIVREFNRYGLLLSDNGISNNIRYGVVYGMVWYIVWYVMLWYVMVCYGI